jgi:recombination protein RecA
MGQGKENAKEFLVENQDVAQEIEARLRVALHMTPPEEEGEVEGEGEKEGDDSPAAKEDSGDV